MRAIWKYDIDWSTTLHEIHMPKGALFCHLDKQHGNTTMWFEVDPQAKTESRWFEWFGTGHRVTEGRTYLGTALFDDLGLVLHLHEVLR